RAAARNHRARASHRLLALARRRAAHWRRNPPRGGAGMTALLDISHVTKSFPVGGVLSGKEIRAVDDASFTVGDTGPEIFTIIGESGSGKTTLARMILGLETPTSGEIRFEGQPVSHPNRRERLAFMAKVQPVF